MTERTTTTTPEHARGTVGEVAVVFLKLGLLAYGGLAGFVAMMRREVVEKHRWVSDQEFLDLLGICNLLPGPTAVEMAIVLGYERAGWLALFLAGGLFILPASLLVLALAWAYVHYGSLPVAQWILYGVNPIVIAIIADALWGLTRTAMKNVWLALMAVAVIALYFRGVPILAILAGAVLLGGIVSLAARNEKPMRAAWIPMIGLAAVMPAAIPFSMTRLFLTFLKIGAVSYGAGYVLVAFLRADFVANLHWMTDKQLLDAVAIAQVTPGPIFAASTFIGYFKGGVLGAFLATVGIFLPSFVYMSAVYPVIPALKRSTSARIVLNGINAATVGLMAAVSWQLARDAVIDRFTTVEVLIAFLILWRFKPNSAWLILGGVVAGLGAKLFAR
jgi:chromate transporter